ncbi:recombinase-like helix-turn-helix domain-containing protein [Streptomyces sp. NPDC056600]|uniref:recombinase-like helix-turn-helix domain-containing protein n=1 Tax=Streptomyces sp. NPDC056600 TaxID=3345874 RepID=UPI0036A4D054
MTTRYVVVHQTRTHEPTAYELKLAGALEEVYAKQGHELADVVRGLNSSSVFPPDGGTWTEESFRAEIERLGA